MVGGCLDTVDRVLAEADAQAFQQEVVPGITDLPASSLTIWLDGDGMLVRMLDPQTNWAWERLGHSTDALDLDPTGKIAAAGA